MNPEQMTQSIQEMMQEIAAIKTKQNNDHVRIEENKTLATQIHKVSVNLEHLTDQLKGQNERMDKLIDTYDARLKSQGERIGKLETIAETQSLILEKFQKRLETLENDVEEIKTKGAKRWEGIVEKVIFFIVGAVLMFLAAQIGL